jgi:hypothetical protein
MKWIWVAVSVCLIGAGLSADELEEFDESADEGYFFDPNESEPESSKPKKPEPKTPDGRAPAVAADYTILAKRIEALEARVRDLESRAVETVAVTQPAVQDLPVLEIHSETWCGPCQTLKADLEALGETGVNVKWVRFSDRVPAMRWVGADGKPQIQTGYTRGTIRAILDRVTAAHVARSKSGE